MNTIAVSKNVLMIPAKKKIQKYAAPENMLRAAAYCRVSKDEAGQQNSYSSQISYYTDHINNNPEWRFAGIYSDEGISGTLTKNRTGFNKMIKAARQGKIDIILCKSISQFARNTVDCLDYVRELRSLGVTVIFEKENINTSSMSSEFAISLYASFAQAESESISRNVTWGIEKSFREGNVRYQVNQMLGYRLGADGKPYIVDDEAEIVRNVFRRYSEGYTPTEIAQELTDINAKRRNGSTVWKRNNVYQILKNEKYAGDALMQKTYTVNCITHDRANNTGQKPMYFVQNCHEAIIDRETYDIVRLELERRKHDSKKCRGRGRYSTKYSLSSLLVCPYCGGAYKRTTWLIKGEKKGVWRCKNRMEGKKCPISPSYHEDVLQSTIVSAINSFIENKVYNISDTGADYSENKTAEKRISEIISELADIERQMDNILSGISSEMFEEAGDELRELNRRESRISNELEEPRYKQGEYRRNKLKEKAAVNLMKGLSPLGSYDEKIISGLVSKVEAVSKNELYIILYGGHKVKQSIVKN